jgi:hypothetical protein
MEPKSELLYTFGINIFMLVPPSKSADQNCPTAKFLLNNKWQKPAKRETL